MEFSNELLNMEHGDSVLLSLHPRHAQKILSGEKRLEFRRSWASREVSRVVIYVTVPVKKIVAIATVKEVHYGSPTALWDLAKKIGGGLTRRELYDYLAGREAGYAIELEDVKQFVPALETHQIFNDFRPPQSFSYLDHKTVSQLESLWQERRSEGRVIFISGVHGVGKTTLCEKFRDLKGVQHRSASQLIREAKAEALAIKGKAVKDIEGNQKLLADAVRKLRATGTILLLDGHFALLDTDNQPQALNTSVFAELGISAVIAVHDNSNAIASRLAMRDGQAMSIKAIKELQTLELIQADRVSRDLCIPFSLVKSFDQKTFDEEASRFLA